MIKMNLIRNRIDMERQVMPVTQRANSNGEYFRFAFAKIQDDDRFLICACEQPATWEAFDANGPFAAVCTACKETFYACQDWT